MFGYKVFTSVITTKNFDYSDGKYRPKKRPPHRPTDMATGRPKKQTGAADVSTDFKSVGISDGIRRFHRNSDGYPTEYPSESVVNVDQIRDEFQSSKSIFFKFSDEKIRRNSDFDGIPMEYSVGK